MPQYASATVVGHLGRDPELKYTQGGTPVVNCAVAVTRKRGQEESTTWWRVALFGKRAEVVAQNLTKGDPALFSGEPYLEKWQGRDGTEQQTLCLDARDFAFIGGKRAQESRPQESYQAPSARYEAPSAQDHAPFDDIVPF